MRPTQFDFSAKPKVIASNKAKYRQPAPSQTNTQLLSSLEGTNLMNDPRVVRGNTYAAAVEGRKEVRPPPRKIQGAPPSKIKATRIPLETGFQPSTPDAVSGRQHFKIQTQPFVQALKDRPNQYEYACQTDLFLDRPVQRQFDPMKGKIGVDKVTQIQENDAELFNFEMEVQPIVEALLNKVIQTSRMQLYDQAELKAKQQQKLQFQRRRHAKLAEAHKLEANEQRLKQEAQRRQLQSKKSSQEQAALEKKVIGRLLSKQYLKGIKNNTHLMLREEGFFRPPLETALLDDYTPWLLAAVSEQLQTEAAILEATQIMIAEGEQKLREEANRPLKEREDARRKEQETKNKKKRERRQTKERLKMEAEEEELKKLADAQAAEAPPAPPADTA